MYIYIYCILYIYIYIYIAYYIYIYKVCVYIYIQCKSIRELQAYTMITVEYTLVIIGTHGRRDRNVVSLSPLID